MSEAVVTAGAAIELANTGSLCHDDVIDRSHIRRNQPTLNARWNDGDAVMAGNVVMMSGLRLAFTLGGQIGSNVTEMIAELCEGVVEEREDLYRLDRDHARYFRSIAAKSASIIESACMVGAATAGMSPVGVQAFADYGRHLGVAFQIVDDIADILREEAFLGKRAGNDIRTGVYTLPVLLAAEQSAELRDLLNAEIDDAGVDRACQLVVDTSGIDDALRIAAGEVEQAVVALRGPADAEGFNADIVGLLCLLGELMLSGEGWRAETP